MTSSRKPAWLSRDISWPDIHAAVDRVVGADLLKSRLFAALLIVGFVGLFLLNIVPFIFGWPVDSPSYYTAAWSLRRGADLYDERAFQETVAAIFGKSQVVYPFIYPPLFAQLCLPLTLLPPEIFFAVTLGLNILLTFLCLYLIARLLDLKSRPTYLPLIFLFALIVFNQPLVTTLKFGQINLLVLDLILLFLVYRKAGRPSFATFFLSLAVFIKIFPVLFILPFLVNKKWKPLMAFALNSSGLFVLSGLISGLGPWRSFGRMMIDIFFKSADTVAMRGLSDSVRNLSLKSFLSQGVAEVGLPRSWATPLFIVVVASFFLAVYALRKRISLGSDILLEGSIFLVLTLILAPIGWSHHYVIMIFPIAYFFTRIIDERRTSAVFPLLFLSAFIIEIPSRGGFPFNQLRMLATVSFLVFLLFFARARPRPNHA